MQRVTEDSIHQGRQLLMSAGWGAIWTPDMCYLLHVGGFFLLCGSKVYVQGQAGDGGRRGGDVEIGYW